jgi:predicted Fe-Mo cluster-binding NifX family protein
MKAAFAYLDKRIAPVFDTAQRIHIVEVESGRIVNEKQEILGNDRPMQKTLRLAELDIRMLVCGAISRPLQAMVAAYGIQMVPFVAGDLNEVIQAWLNGSLRENNFAMPGCCQPSRRRVKKDDINKEAINMNGKGRGGSGAGGGQGQGRGGMGSGGQGRGGKSGPLAGGAVGICLCPKCGHRETHELRVPCVQRQCPKCGTGMTRE